MGIAMCHFELAARALGIPGAWGLLNPASLNPGTLKYIATWYT